MKQKLIFVLIFGVGLISGLLISAAILYFPFDRGLTNKALAYINENFLADQGAKAEITNVHKICGWQADFNLNANGRSVGQGTFYITDDQLLILGQAIDISDYSETKLKSDRPKIDLWVMSFCPFGQQAEAGLIPVLKLLGDKVDFNLHFIVAEQDGKYVSLHGPAELTEDIRQLCIFSKDKRKWYTYVSYVRENCTIQNIDRCWIEAAKTAGLDVNEIELCTENEGQKMIAEDAREAVQKNILASPTLLINGRKYNGKRSPEAYKNAICEAFNKPPKECNIVLSSNSSAYGYC